MKKGIVILSIVLIFVTVISSCSFATETVLTNDGNTTPENYRYKTTTKDMLTAFGVLAALFALAVITKIKSFKEKNEE